MSSQVARSVGSLVLLTALTILLGLPLVAVIYGQLECNVYKCVQVGYKAKAPPEDLRNVYCVYKSTTTPEGQPRGWAYRREFAHGSCLGQNSIGGQPDVIVESLRDYVVCRPDCTNVRPPCSGEVVEYLGGPDREMFPTKCQLPPPPPPPEPDPDPDP